MRKSLRTIIALCAVAFGSTAWAQTWTGSSVAAGDFYLYNVSTKQYLCGANSYGTQASVGANGIYVTLAGSDKTYTISTANLYSNDFLGSNLYVDNRTSTDWTFTAVDGQTNVYTISNTSGYVSSNGEGAALTQITTATEASYWMLITKTERDEALAKATLDSPVDATYYIGNPDFSRNAITSWQGSPSIGGNQENYCAEKWNTTFDVNQSISGLPNGKYVVSCQGFYRDGTNNVAYPEHTSSTESLNAYLYAGDNQKALMSVYDEAGKSSKLTSTGTYDTGNGKYVPNTMPTASTAFSEGLYSDNSVECIVTGGTLQLGVKKTVAVSEDWSIFDNFSLKYYGKVIASEAQELPTTGNLTADTWYKYTVTVAGEYTITASTIADIVYTADGEQALTSPTTTAASATMTLEAGTYYFKSSSAQTLTIEAATKSYEVGDATITPADGNYVRSFSTVTIAFPNATTNDASASLKILNTNGVTCGDQTATLSMDGTTVTATFASAITLELGGTASVKIAAGTIGYSSDHANTEITATYKNGNIADGLYYLYDTTNKTFLSMGADYLTAAVCDDYGMLLNVAMQSDGCYTFQFVATSNYLFDAVSEKTFTDNSKNNHWVISSSEDNLAITNGNETNYKGQNLYNNGTNVINSSSNATAWKLMTSSERNSVIAAAQEAQEKSVATAASATSVEDYISSRVSETTTYVAEESAAQQYYMGSRVWSPVSVSLFTAESLPEGIYKIHADAFFRSSYYNETDKDAGRAYIKAVAGDNTYKMQIASPFDMTITSTSAWSSAGPNDVQYGEYYYPNNTTSAAAAMKAGNYGHDLYVYVGSAEQLVVSLAFDGFVWGSWLCYNNVTLTQYDELTVEIKETGKYADNEYYATYVTTATTDLSKCDFKAYSVTTNGTELTYTEQTGIVPAGTPLVIKGTEAKTYTVVASQSEGTAITSNDLKDAGSETTGDGSTIYILAKGSNGLGWYLCTEGTTIAANKCYLKISNSASVKFIGLDGIASGISSVSSEQSNSNARYNLSGQRVNKGYKGIVIENGKKYLLK